MLGGPVGNCELGVGCCLCLALLPPFLQADSPEGREVTPDSLVMLFRMGEWIMGRGIFLMLGVGRASPLHFASLLISVPLVPWEAWQQGRAAFGARVSSPAFPPEGPEQMGLRWLRRWARRRVLWRGGCCAKGTLWQKKRPTPGNVPPPPPDASMPSWPQGLWWQL